MMTGVKDQSAVQEFELPQFFGTYLKEAAKQIIVFMLV